MKRPRVEILYFADCPNYEGARALVQRLAAGLGIEPELHLVEVSDAHAATRLQFLGSPTVRVDGHDVEPGADQRSDYVLSCRVYRGEHGLSGPPEERWVRDALVEAMQ